MGNHVVIMAGGIGSRLWPMSTVDIPKQFVDDLGVPCSGCRYCCDNCPEALDIPLLIRYFNEKSLGGEAWKIPGLEQAKGAEHCLQCGACMEHCPQKINIPDVMAKLQKKE